MSLSMHFFLYVSIDNTKKVFSVSLCLCGGLFLLMFMTALGCFATFDCQLCQIILGCFSYFYLTRSELVQIIENP